MSDSESTTAWVTVAEAAEKAHVDTGTIRQWYRAGRVPTRRAEGQGGAFLVPLDLVLSIARPPEPDAPATADTAPSIEEALRGLNADYWSSETESVKEELASARTELAASREQLEFLRAQLAESNDENRAMKDQLAAAENQRADLRAQLADVADDRKGVAARLATVEAELTQLRRTAARSSITDNSWLDEQTPAYQSPVRRQAMATPPPPPPSTSDGPTAPYSPAATVGGELTDLLAATRPDGGDDDDLAATPTGATWSPDQDDEDDRYNAPRAIWTDEAPHPPLGESPDDLFPDSDKGRRFGKK